MVTKKKKSKKRHTKKKKSKFQKFMKFGIISTVWAIIILSCYFIYLAISLPDIDQITKRVNLRPKITFLDANNELITTYGDSYNRVPIAHIPNDLINAVISTEDRSFFDHSGFDPVGFTRAMVTNLQHLSLVQGGSTITQQLAKNLFLTNNKTVKRKIQEVIMATYIELKFSKEEILESYLNNVYFGSGNYGVESAANDYFNKNIYDIDFEESVMLAGLLKAPSAYNPKAHMDRAIKRAETVIIALRNNNIEIPEYDFNRVKISEHKSNPELGNARYFTDMVQDSIYGYIGEPKQDIIVKTTLNPHVQSLAESSISSYKSEILERNADQVAMVSMQKDGAIVAMMGGMDYSKSQFNRVAQSKRQSGSAFKPIVYLSALDTGMKPKSKINDEPLKIGNWEPQNFDLKFHGEVNLQESLVNSYNIPAIKIMQKIGINKVINMARKLGITSDLERNLTTALGTNSISLLELTNAYTIMANKGYNITPYSIRSISTKDGNVVYEHTPIEQKIIKKKPLKYINNMLKDVVLEGTGKNANIKNIKCYGKTGTTQKYKDAWFIGYTDKLVTGVWIGNDNATPTDKITGGSIPAKIWKDFNEKSYKITKEKEAVPKKSFWDMLFNITKDIDTEPASSATFN